MKKSSEQKYRPEWKAEVDSFLLDLPDVKEGHMFCYPAYYVNRKLAVCHYGDGIALKLPADRASALKESDPVCEAFCPMGKSMGSQWVILNPERAEDIRGYEEVMQESVTFLKTDS